jgi:GrpB-like predicted nucleotidyltransferase (UPF0157 family)
VTFVSVEVVRYSELWPAAFASVSAVLGNALADIGSAQVEHVGSTSVPGLAAKPVLDIDVIVDTADVVRAVTALEEIGYVHRGDLGVAGREAFHAPDESPRRHVYVCERGTLHVRNHLAVREVLRRDAALRDEYSRVKLELAADPAMDIDTYIARKSGVLQEVLARSDLTPEECREILRLNDPDA